MASNKRVSKERGPKGRADSSCIIESEQRVSALRSDRRLLMRANSVLGCVAVALEYDGPKSEELDFADAIEVARELISQSIERLELHSSSSVAAGVQQ
jgi:hypothetical protein